MNRTRRDILETLLRLRRQSETSAKEETVRADARFSAIQRDIAKLRDSMYAASDQTREAIRRGTSAPDAKRTLDVSQNNLRKRFRLLKEAMQDAAQSRTKLRDAIRSRRALQKLQARRTREENLNHRRREQKELDELHSMHRDFQGGAVL